MRAFLSAIGALSVLNILGALAQAPPACVETCTNQLRNDFGKFACGSATDAGCLCTKDDFKFGIRDCASAGCGANDGQVETYLSTSFCQGLIAAPAAVATTSSAADAPATTSAAEAAPTSSTSAPLAAETTSSTSAAPTTAVVAETSSTSATSTSTTEPTPSAQETSQSSSQTSSQPTTLATVPATAATTSSASVSGTNSASSPTTSAAKDDGDKDKAASGLSQTATIGIGVGVGAAAIAILAIIMCFFVNKRKRATQQRPSFEISKPLPGAGRIDHDSYEKYNHDIELTAQRYEDMLPRQKPRTMV